MNSIDQSYNNASTMFKGIAPHDGAERLLYLVQKGLEAEIAEEAEVRKSGV